MQSIEDLENEVDSCINCGFCESVCPTLQPSGFRSSIGARGRVDVAKEMLRQIGKGGELTINPEESFYSCLDCHACLQVCPAGVNAGKVSSLGREILASGDLPNLKRNSITKMIVKITMKYENPLGLRRESASWAEGLSFADDSDTLLFTGNMYQLMSYSGSLSKLQEKMGSKFSSFMSGVVSGYPYMSKMFKLFRDKKVEDEMNKHLRNIYRLLKDSGISFSYMGTDEPYPGTFINDLGYKKEFLEYARRLEQKFIQRKVRRIIVVDPHTYDLFVRVMPVVLGAFPFDVVHYLDLIKVKKSNGQRENITFHEPCHLTLRNPEYNRPLEILKSLADVKLPARSGKRLMCCGGPDELLYGTLSRKVSSERLKQLKETGADKIVTACPICLSNLGIGQGITDIATFLSSN